MGAFVMKLSEAIREAIKRHHTQPIIGAWIVVTGKPFFDGMSIGDDLERKTNTAHHHVNLVWEWHRAGMKIDEIAKRLEALGL